MSVCSSVVVAKIRPRHERFLELLKVCYWYEANKLPELKVRSEQIADVSVDCGLAYQRHLK